MVGHDSVIDVVTKDGRKCRIDDVMGSFEDAFNGSRGVGITTKFHARVCSSVTESRR